MTGPKRLIEVDLPIKEISKHARREKSIRHGHISTLHIWWARRPLAACRAVVLASLLPDPADPACPKSFTAEARKALTRVTPASGDTNEELRDALFKFISSFSAWENSTNPSYLECARALVRAAYPAGPPLVVDPFAGGGAIPLEALRVGADAWAGDYNPVAALLLKVVLEDIPKYGEQLAEGVKKWGGWVKERVEADLGQLYPPDSDGAIPIAYLWSRTVTCEGPGCGAEIPLLRQLWLARKPKRSFALKLLVDRNEKSVDFEVIENPAKVADGTVKRGSAVCPVCNIVTPVARVRAQAKAQGGLPVRMVAVVRTYPGKTGRFYRVATDDDPKMALAAEEELGRREKEHEGSISLVPDEPIDKWHHDVNRPPMYGMKTWGNLFLPRQALALSSFTKAIQEAHVLISSESGDGPAARAIATCLSAALGRSVDYWSSLCRWVAKGEFIAATIGGDTKIPMVWDLAEANPFSGATGGWEGAVDWVAKVADHESSGGLQPGRSALSDARVIPLPDDSIPFVFTDPPYYDAIDYAVLADFFYVWLRRCIGTAYPDLFVGSLSPKAADIVVNQSSRGGHGEKDKAFFERGISKAFAEARRILSPDGVAVIVFAHKTTLGWEAILKSLLDTEWIVTGSWPIDTERPGRLREQNSAALASSIHIVCRPRPKDAGTGDWRQVRPQMEQRVAEWLPRLSAEGIEGADAIFACLGPTMEVFSQYERVETASGGAVPLSPPESDPSAPAFLPAVWAAIAKEALRMIFEGPEAEGFEEDARLTALWLWTLRAALDGTNSKQEEATDDEEDAEGKAKKLAGLALDYDTARKLAQALGVDLEELGHPGGIVEIKGSAARLIPVPERRKVLLGDVTVPTKKGGTLFDPDESLSGSVEGGETTLDRLHQAMLLFADGRGEALRRFLSESSDERLLRLARALSALYPASSSEKRWVDGILAALRQRGQV